MDNRDGEAFRRERELAAGARARAAAVLEGFDADLRAVIDTTAALAAAAAEESEAQSRLDAAVARWHEVDVYGPGARGAIAGIELLLAQASAPAARRADPCRSHGTGLADGLETARWARQLTTSVSATCDEIANELGAKREDASARARELRDEITRLRMEIAAHQTPGEAEVRSALVAYDNATSAPTDKLALALADRWAELRHLEAELDRTEPRPPTDEELSLAVGRLEAAEAALAAAAATGRAAVIDADERDAIERAHAAALDARNPWARGARQRKKRAEEELQALLDAHEMSSWLEYLTAGFSVDTEKKADIAAAESEVVRAREALDALLVARTPSPERAQLVEALKCCTQDIIDVLGFWPDGDVERHLRAQPLVESASSARLFRTLVDADVDFGDRPIAAVARGWLEQCERSRRGAGEIEAELANATGHLEALASVELGRVTAEAGERLRQATEVAGEQAQRWGRVEAVLHAALELPQAEDAEDDVADLLDARHRALSWMLTTITHDAAQRHEAAMEDAQRARSARVEAEAAVDRAWAALRAHADDPLPDLPAAIGYLNTLVEESAARERAFMEADARFVASVAYHAPSHAAL